MPRGIFLLFVGYYREAAFSHTLTRKGKYAASQTDIKFINEE